VEAGKLNWAPTRLVVAVQGRSVVLLDSDPDGSARLPLMKMNQQAARRVALELLAAAKSMEEIDAESGAAE
jgi:hypothetical protein